MAERRRIYAPPAAFSDGGLQLDGERLRHLRTVLRLAPGDEFSVTDGGGAEYVARIERLGRDEGRARILSRTAPGRESPLQITLAAAISRAERFALVVEKAAELGVSGIIPVHSRRTLPGAGAAPARWQRVVEAAAAQSGRTVLPVVHAPRPFDDVAADRGAFGLGVLLYEGADDGLRGQLEGRPAPATVLLAVGPEGGWSEREVDAARAAGFLVARIGPRILRTETAAIAGVAVLQHRWGDLG